MKVSSSPHSHASQQSITDNNAGLLFKSLPKNLNQSKRREDEREGGRKGGTKQEGEGEKEGGGGRTRIYIREKETLDMYFLFFSHAR